LEKAILYLQLFNASAKKQTKNRATNSAINLAKNKDCEKINYL